MPISFFSFSMHDGGMCGCPHHKMVPFLLVLIGVAFLLQTVGVLTAEVVAMVWPVGLILIGLVKLSGGVCGCCGMKKK